MAHMGRNKRMEKNKFETLYAVNVNDKTEKKNGLTYLSWAWAWAEFKKVYPKADYKVYKNADGLPYAFDPNTGYMCYVTVDNGEGESHEMWLPVMDSANNAMTNVPYTMKTKYKETVVNRATMFDVNKTIMRALVKCLGMFGLALYIYAGEDLPEEEKEEEKNKPKTASEFQVKSLKEIYKDRFADFLKANGFATENDITMEVASAKIKEAKEALKRQKEAKNATV